MDEGSPLAHIDWSAASGPLRGPEGIGLGLLRTTDLPRRAAATTVVDAGPRGWPRFKPCCIDRLAADLADSVRSSLHAVEGGVDLLQMLPRLTSHRRQLGALVGDRLTLRVVFVIGIGVSRRRDEGGHVVTELGEASTKDSPLLVKACHDCGWHGITV